MTAPAASPAPVAEIFKTSADPGRLQWLTRMTFASKPGPMTREAYDAVAAEAAAVIAGGTCPEPGLHRLHVRYLNERCPGCGGAS